MNISGTAEGCLDVSTGRLSIDTSPLVDALVDAFEDFREIAAQGRSQVHLCGCRPQLLCCVDRGLTK